MIEKLIEVQAKLNRPKCQYNSFGKYSYRNCEDILERVKPLLKEAGLCLTVTDEIRQIGDRYYVKATATVTDGSESVSTTAWAREPDTKKGMDDSQITGAASSYARKYALNGLFCIDDNRDADTGQNGTRGKREASQGKRKATATDDMTEVKKQAFREKAAQPAPVSREQTWEDVAKGPQYQTAKCVVCGKPLEPVFRAKVFAKYGTFVCSGECKAELDRRKAANE